MQALQFQALNQVALIETERPQIKDDELLIETGAATICTTDLNDIRENPFGIKLPVITGHEGAGTVVAIGSRVTGFKIGDRVATHPVHPCGQCADCRQGRRHLCPFMEHLGLNRPGAFAEYFAVRMDRARHIPDGVPFTVGALAEPVSVCLEALAQANLQEGARLLILGDGPFGVLMARLAASLPLDKCVISGRHDYRLQQARGAIPVNAKTDPNALARLRAEGGESGYDAAILAVGNPEALREGLALLRPKGRMVLFSAIPGRTPIDLLQVHLRELEIVGACSDQDRLDQAVQMLSDPALGPEDLVTHTFPLEDYQAALAQAATGHDDTLKVAFVFPGQA